MDEVTNFNLIDNQSSENTNISSQGQLTGLTDNNVTLEEKINSDKNEKEWIYPSLNEIINSPDSESWNKL